jgi:hypothetical protein
MNVPLILGLLTLAIAIIHEISWFKRRNWIRISGTIIDIHRREKNNKISFAPVILYSASKGEKQFISKYGGSVLPKIGDTAIVFVSPDGESQEHYSTSNRWFATAIPFILAVLFLIKAYIDLRS